MPPHPDGAPRPIETRYAGCRFRSRLEARWACFFDTLGIAWEYEPQGYLVGPDARPYLPDFWLPGEKVWAEVKGSQDQLDIALLVDAAFPENGLPASGRSTDDFDREVRMLILGPIARGMTPWTSGGKTLGVVQPAPSLLLHCADGIRQTDGAFTDTGLWTDSDGPLVADNAREIQWHSRKLWEPLIVGGCEVLSWGPQLAAQGAYRAARSARFEHGETGRDSGLTATTDQPKGTR